MAFPPFDRESLGCELSVEVWDPPMVAGRVPQLVGARFLRRGCFAAAGPGAGLPEETWPEEVWVEDEVAGGVAAGEAGGLGCEPDCWPAA